MDSALEKPVSDGQINKKHSQGNFDINGPNKISNKLQTFRSVDSLIRVIF